MFVANSADWPPMVAAVAAGLALVVGGYYYGITVRDNRITHYFDVLMRTVSVYKDVLPTKRQLGARYIRRRLGQTRLAPTSAEELAVADILRYFDTASWQAFRVFGRLELQKCSLVETCTHVRFLGIGTKQQRHESVRVMIKEIGFPAYMYYELLEACGQDDAAVVREARLSAQTELRRMHAAMRAYFPKLFIGKAVTCPRKPDACSGRPCFCRTFIDRECQASSLGNPASSTDPPLC